MKTVLTIGGSDSSAGAGIQADLKTFEAHGLYCTTVITAVTAQNTLGIRQAMPVPDDLVFRQLEAVSEDFRIAGVKIGMLAIRATVERVASFLDMLPTTIPVVLDPLIRSSSGTPMLDDSGITSLKESLFARVTLITPNRSEAAYLAGPAITTATSPDQLASLLRDAGADSVLITGGDSPEGGMVLDYLLTGSGGYVFTNPYLTTAGTHGTGCTLASAICANLVMGYTMVESVARGRDYTFNAIRRAPGLGRGKGPLMHRNGEFD